MIRTESELAAALRSRGDLYTSNVPSYEKAGWVPLIPLAMALLFLLCHFYGMKNVYAVQLSRLTGNYVSAEAIVLSTDEKTVTHHRHLQRGHGKPGRHVHRRTGSVSKTSYTIVAEAPDGTRFTFTGPEIFAQLNTVTVNYVRGRPDLSYLPDYQNSKFIWSGIFLIISGIFMYCSFYIYRCHRRCHELIDRGLYLPVSKNGKYDTRQVSTRRRGRHEEYAPYYQYTLPNGKQLEFRGEWSRNDPDEDTDADSTEYRVYMLEPENPYNRRFFILKVPD